MISFNRVFTLPQQAGDDQLSQIGCVASILMASKESHRPFRYLQHSAIPALFNKSLQVYFNEDKKPVAYIIWARITEQVEARLLENGNLGLHRSEWNEGHVLWVLDLVAPYGNLKYIMRHARDVLFPQDVELKYVRRRGNRLSTVCLNRACLPSILRGMPPAEVLCLCQKPDCIYNCVA